MQKPLTVAEAAKRLEAVLNEAEATAAKWEARRAALEAERLRNRQQWQREFSASNGGKDDA